MCLCLSMCVCISICISALGYMPHITLHTPRKALEQPELLLERSGMCGARAQPAVQDDHRRRCRPCVATAAAARALLAVFAAAQVRRRQQAAAVVEGGADATG